MRLSGAAVTRIRVWDLPLRLFHWALVIAVVAAFITAKAGNLEAHAVAGQVVLGLLVFRVSWGFLGSTHARFAQFVRGPRAISDYIQGRWQGVGHNPLGALSVLAMLGVLLVQACSGLFANDDSTFTGPLASLVSGDVSDRLSRLHRLQEWPIVGLVLLHVGAIVFYLRVKKTNLVKPMITGYANVDSTAVPPPQGGGAWALAVALLLALAAVGLSSGAWIPPAPPAEALPPSLDW